MAFQVKSHTVVCSLHFEEDSVEVSGFSKRRFLKPGAVPTIFDCWKDKPHLYKPSAARRENVLQKKKRLASEDNDAANNVSDVVTDDNSIGTVIETCTQIDTHEKIQLQNQFLIQHNSLLERKLEALEQENAKVKLELCRVREEKASVEFRVENLKPSDFPFYTGFPSREIFNTVLALVDPGENGENVVLVTQKDCNIASEGQKIRKPRKLSPANQFFLFLCRTRVGLLETDLARRFNISVGTVSTVVISWANFLYLRLGSVNIWPTRDMVNITMPSSFKEKYPTTRAVIDCTEIKVEMPSSLLLKSQTYSNYKGANTLKGLIGIAPCGSITFVSQLYHGNISDREITIRSGFLELDFDKGDSVMADKGFDIQDLLDKKGVKLNIPPYLGQYGQMTAGEVTLTQSIAAERIHVERAINKIKNFHIFDQIIPVTLFGSINQIWVVCALLTLFHEPIISCPGLEKKS